MTDRTQATAARGAVVPKPPRDPRLDFFRGIALLSIVISHAPNNPWARWLPARFGFSDAAEIFVFCSGFASALAFGATFVNRGWLLGTARILHRVWQIYWAHVASFVVITAAMVMLSDSGSLVRDYVGQLNLKPFLKDPGENLVGLLTLTYVPNYFDILPMYLVILAMVPAAVALARVNLGLLALASLALWITANTGWLNLPAEPWSDRQWFFNPFGWQLLFFLGFAFASGWLRPPAPSPTLVAIAAGFLILTLPIAHPGIRNAIPAFGELRDGLMPIAAKTPQGPLRLLHFLALAWLAWIATGPGGARLVEGLRWRRLVALIRAIGQQSLAVFLVGLLASRLMGVGLDILGRGVGPAALVNLAGLASCLGTALLVGWFKSQPWRAPSRPALPVPEPDPVWPAAAERPSP